MSDLVNSMRCNISLKFYFLDSNLDFFPENLEADEYGECFHQQISTIEKKYQGKWSANILADYCWTMKRGILMGKYTRKTYNFLGKPKLHYIYQFVFRKN